MRFKKEKGEISSNSELELFEKAPIGILIFDENWKVTKVNSNFLKLGIVKTPFRYELAGKSILNVNVFESPEIFPLINSLHSNKTFEREIKSLNTIDGSEITIILKGVPLFEGEKFKGGILIAEDLKISADAKRDRLFSSDLVVNLFSNLSDFYLITDTAGNIVQAVNSSDKKIFDVLQKSIGRKLTEIFFPVLKHSVGEILRVVVSSGQPFESELGFFPAEEKQIVKAKFIPFKQENGEVEFVLVLLTLKETKVTAGKETSEKDTEQLKAEEVFEILNDIDESVIILDFEGNINFINEQALKICGKKKEELLGQFCNKLFPLFDKSKFAELKKEILEKKKWIGKLPFFKTDKEQSIEAKITYEELGGEKYLLLLCKEGEEKTEDDDAAKRVTENFRKIINITKEFIITFRPDGKIIFVNPHFTQEFKYHVDEAINLNFMNLIDKNSEHINGFSFEKISKQNVTTIDLPLKTKDGRVLICQATINAIKDSKGEVKYFNAILKDVTGEHHAKNELRKLYKVLNSLDNGVIELVKGKAVFANEKFADILKYEKPKEIIGKEVSELLVPENEERISDLFSAKPEKNHQSLEISWLTKNGRPVKLNSILYPLADTEKILVVVKEESESVSHKLPERKSFEIENIIENLDGFVWTAEEHNGKLKVNYYSDNVLEVTGYKSKDFIENEKLWINIIHPEDTEKVVSGLREFYHDKIKSNKLELEYRLIRKDGMTIWVNNKITVKRNENGKVEKVYGLVTDITKKKKSEEELKKYTDDLKKLNETKDRFISIISHDLRTPFSSILGFTDMLLTEKDLDDEKKNQYIGFIKESALNMLSLVNSLLDWIRLQTGKMKFEPSGINAKEILTKVIQMLSGRAMQKGVSIISELDHDFYVYADPDLLMIILNNLISNALKFTPSGGSIKVKGRYLIDKKMVEFSVRDTGVGMDEEETSKLFRIDEKFTTLGTDGERGSGLGLKLVHEIVKRHGGEISVKSKKGEGTEMIFTLPVAANSILLVDDSQTDRILYSRIIKSMLPGYEIIEAVNGKDALAKLEKEISPSLIISDHSMPEMNGYEFVRQLSASVIKFKPPVIILSEDIDEDLRQMYGKLGIQHVFKKPVNLSAFKKALEDSLRESVLIS